jgi:hypothetical protein
MPADKGEPMIMLDKNQTWTPPKGYEFSSLVVAGGYFHVRYQKTVIHTNPAELNELFTVDVYLNDQGREVLRTENKSYISESPIVASQPQKTFWEQLLVDVKDLFTGRI